MLGLFVLGEKSNEPVYKGKPLSRWLDEQPIGYHRMPEEIRRAELVEEAVRAIGTNAVPFLSRLLNTRDFPFREANQTG